MAAPTFRKRRIFWSQRENGILIDCVGELNVLEELSGKRVKSAEIWRKVGEAVAAQGVKKSWEQCRQRWKNLRLDYNRAKKTAASDEGNGEPHANYRYMEQLDELFANRHSSVDIIDVEIGVETHFDDTNPQELVGSPSHEPEGASEYDSQGMVESGRPNRQAVKGESCEEPSEDASGEDAPSPCPSERACSSGADIAGVYHGSGGGVSLKRKRPQASKQEMALQKMIDAQGKILSALQEDNQNFWTRAAQERHDRDQQLITQLTTAYERSCENLVQGFLSGMQSIMGQMLGQFEPDQQQQQHSVPTYAAQNHNMSPNGIYHHQTSTTTTPAGQTPNCHNGTPRRP